MPRNICEYLSNALCPKKNNILFGHRTVHVPIYGSLSMELYINKVVTTAVGSRMFLACCCNNSMISHKSHRKLEFVVEIHILSCFQPCLIILQGYTYYRVLFMSCTGASVAPQTHAVEDFCAIVEIIWKVAAQNNINGHICNRQRCLSPGISVRKDTLAV